MTSALHKIGSVSEGLLLLALAGFAGWLTLGDSYWMLLNPTFKPLTAVFSAGLAVFGIILFRTTRQFSWQKSIPLAFALACCIIAVSDSWERPAPGFSNPEQADSGPSRLVMNEHEYIKINTAELFSLVQNTPDSLKGELFVLRGQALRSPTLDKEGFFVLARTAIVCCLADSVTAGFLVPWPQTTTMAHGEWVQVFGKIAPMARTVAFPKDINADLAFPAANLAIEQQHILLPDHLQPTPAPEIPYIFATSDAEPFFY